MTQRRRIGCAEEIGRRVAQELTGNFAKLGADLLAQQSKAHLAAETFASLRRAITLELRGFNQVVRREFRLTMLPGQNCLIFTFETRLALTLKVDAARVRLVLAPPSNVTLKAEDGRPSIEFSVSQSADRFSYQKIGPPSVAPARILSQAEFIEGVIRVACNQPFERTKEERKNE